MMSLLRFGADLFIDREHLLRELPARVYRRNYPTAYDNKVAVTVAIASRVKSGRTLKLGNFKISEFKGHNIPSWCSGEAQPKTWRDTRVPTFRRPYEVAIERGSQALEATSSHEHRQLLSRARTNETDTISLFYSAPSYHKRPKHKNICIAITRSDT